MKAAVITEGVLISMFLSKVKLVMTAVAVVAALTAGAVALAQSGIGRPKDGTAKPQHVGSPSWTYHILVSRSGEPPRKLAVVEMTGDTPIRIDAPDALILVQPKRDGEPDLQIAIAGPASQNQNRANPSGAGSSRSVSDQEHRKIVLTSPKAMDVAVTQRYVCQIHAQRYINIRALEKGILSEIRVREGQFVKKGDLMFKIDTARSRTKADPAKAEMDFTNIIAPFDGLVGRLHMQQASLVMEGDVLTTLSDHSMIWVYFKVPEKQYLEYMADRKLHEGEKIELVLANRTKFPQPGKLGAIQANFDNQTGTIAFRADFPNPDGLLRHGQSGTILIHRKLHDAIVIPQRATYENLDKRYVYLVDKDDVAHRREIAVQNEVDGIFVIKKGVGVGDRIVLEGIRQVRDGEKVQYEFRPPEEVMRNLRKPAE
jgi:membrane fusion protein (multidrug efflux system)